MSVSSMGTSGGRTPALGQYPQTARQKAACSAESVTVLAGQGLAIPNQAPTAFFESGTGAARTLSIVPKVKSKAATANIAKPGNSDLRGFIESSSSPHFVDELWKESFDESSK